MRPMVLFVDFNMRKTDGTVPAALLPEQARALAPGVRVIAADGEGTECKAVVVEVFSDRRYALLKPDGKTWNRESNRKLAPNDVFATKPSNR